MPFFGILFPETERADWGLDLGVNNRKTKVTVQVVAHHDHKRAEHTYDTLLAQCTSMSPDVAAAVETEE